MTNLALIGGKKEARGSSQQLAQVSRGMHVLEGAAVYARSTLTLCDVQCCLISL